MIEVVVFDLDDTLFPEHEFVMSGFQVVSEWVATKYSNPKFFEVAWQFFQAGKRHHIFNLTLEKLGVEYEPWMIQELVQIYRQHTPVISLYEDAKWAINHFIKSKKLCIITDGYFQTQQKKVEALKIKGSFDTIIYSDLYGRENWKPSQLSYNKIMEAVRCRGSECIYVADNPRKDFVTAKRLDWMTVQIYREGGEYSSVTTETSHEADIKISSLTELEVVLS